MNKYRAYFFILILFPSFLWAHYDSAYFHSANDAFTFKKDWMKKISDDVMLSAMALPGTHDSGTYKLSGRPILGTQALTIKQQLDYGIRVLDIRVRHTSNRFAIHHGAAFLNLMFGDVLCQIESFLQENPSETVLFRLKEDHTPDTNNTQSMRETLADYLAGSKYYLNTSDEYITLAKARGKFIILTDNYNFSGIPYGSADIQDDYHLNTNWDLYSKWSKISSHLNKAIAGRDNVFYINYLSGSGGVFPYFVASGHSSAGTSAPRLATGLTTPGWKNSYPSFPRVACFIGICTIAFEGTNIMARNVIVLINVQNNLSKNLQLKLGAGAKNLSGNNKRTVGIIMADFPGESLIQAIINNNKNLQVSL